MIEIKTGNIPCPVYISDVEEHIEFKNYFLEFLKYKPVSGLRGPAGKMHIYNTDYGVNSSESAYKKQLYPIITKHNDKLSSLLGYSDRCRIKPFNELNDGGIWFQQYQKDNQHDWHRHHFCTFSNVYYVDLPNNAAKTTFRYKGEEFEINVEEGQILTFPSFLEHCSKPNKSDQIKTIISFNSA